MANGLTGGNDVVARFSAATVNRALAALHRDEVLPHLHRGLRLDDAASGVHSTVDVQISPPSLGCDCPGARTGGAERGGRPGGVVEGGSDGWTVPGEGAASGEVSARFDVRAATRRDLGTTPLPLDLHGELCAAFRIERLGIAADLELVTLDPTCAHFTAAPSSGLSAGMEDRVRGVISRWMLAPARARSIVVPLVFTLRSGEELRIRDWGFHVDFAAASTTVTALTLALQLHRAARARPSSVTGDLLAGQHAAFALADDLVERKILDALPRVGESFESFPNVTITGVTASLRDGGFRVAISGRSPWLLGTIRFTITQDARVTLAAGRVRVSPDGDFRLDVSPGVFAPFVRLFARDALREARDDAFARAQVLLEAELSASGALGGLIGRVLNPSGSRTRPPTPMGFSPADIVVSADGVLVRGAIDFGADRPIQVRFVQRALLALGPRYTELNALESWIPGGTIELFRWRVGSGSLTSVQEDEHSFLHFLGRRSGLREPSLDPLDPPLPAEALDRLRSRLEPEDVRERVSDPALPWLDAIERSFEARLDLVDAVGERDGAVDVCLEVEGWSPGPGGERIRRARSHCGMAVPVLPPLGMPAGVEMPPLLEVPAARFGAPRAHIAPWGLPGRPSAFSDADGTNLVLHFPFAEGGDSIEVLERLAERAVAAGAPLTVLTIAAESASFAGKLASRLESSARASAGGEPEGELPVITWLWARDHGGAWRSAFQVGNGGLLLLDRRGEVVRRSQGSDDIEALAEALAASAGGGPVWWLLDAGVRAGERAPATRLPYGDRLVPLHRFRGGRVALCFWRPGLEPSLEQVRRLARWARSNEDLTVVAVADGVGTEGTEVALPKAGTRLATVADRSGQVGHAFGIWCWPTTVLIDEAGMVDEVQLGLRAAAADPALPRRSA